MDEQLHDIFTSREAMDMDGATALCQNVLELVAGIAVTEDFVMHAGAPPFALYIGDLNLWSLELDRIPSVTKYQIKFQYLQTYEILNRKRIDVERWQVRYNHFKDFQGADYQDQSSGQKRFCAVVCTLGFLGGYVEKYLPDLESRLTTWGNFDHESTWLDCGIQIAQLIILHRYVTTAIKTISDCRLLVKTWDFKSSIVLIEKATEVLNAKLQQAEQFQTYHQTLLNDCNTDFVKRDVPGQIIVPENLRVVRSSGGPPEILRSQEEEVDDMDVADEVDASEEGQGSTAGESDGSEFVMEEDDAEYETE